MCCSHLRQKFDPGRARQPLVGQHQRDVRGGVAELAQRGERSLRRRVRNDFVVWREPPLQTAPNSLEGTGIVGDRKDRGDRRLTIWRSSLVHDLTEDQPERNHLGCSTEPRGWREAGDATRPGWGRNKRAMPSARPGTPLEPSGSARLRAGPRDTADRPSIVMLAGISARAATGGAPTPRQRRDRSM